MKRRGRRARQSKDRTGIPGLVRSAVSELADFADSTAAADLGDHKLSARWMATTMLLDNLMVALARVWGKR